jgi:Right handed beta helix region
MKTLGYFVIMMFCLATRVQATQVYSGCAIPPSTFRHVWYFDPVHGKTMAAGGNGSQASPWNNLQALVQAESGYTYPLLTTAPYLQAQGAGLPWTTKTGPKAGPIAPGDEILLMSGNYGDLWLNVWNTEIANSAFVTVAAAPGQTPVLKSLFVAGTEEWAFNGLKVQSLQPAALSGHWLVDIDDYSPTFPTSNIVLENMTVSSQDNVSGWSQAQWIANARNGVFVRSPAGTTAVKCVSMTGSHITNIKNGAALAAGQMFFSGNQIDHFGDDGIDFEASNLAITHNSIHDNLNIGDGNHEDAMQGQAGFLAAGATVSYFSNVLIDSNLIVRQTDPHLAFPTYLQGIDAFDADWTNVTATNNVVVTSSCYGIGFESVHNSLVADNTVIEDGLVSTPGCVAAIDVGGATHAGRVSNSTIVRNNLTSRLNVDTRDSGVTADHNVVMCCKSPEISWYVNKVSQFIGQPGVYTNGNIIDKGGTNAEFVNFNPTTLTYNVLLKSGAQAIGAGTAAGAPTIDTAGVKRTTPYTVGAYGYPN